MQARTHTYHLVASEFQWEISKGKTINAWGFNNSVPGPTLRARQGDTIVVKFRNELNEPTVIHWHGIQLPAAMDGTDSVQKPVAPGEEFEYRFVVPDAGTFWYHSHQNETEQMEKGMYGSLIVDDESSIVVDAERVLMIDDMKLTSNNEFAVGNRLMRWIERHDGREGRTLLINGKEMPSIVMNAGQTERWRLVNASSAKYFRLYLGGKNFKLIATDGGFIEHAVELNELMLVPGERADILVGPFDEGETIAVESLRYNRMTMLKAKRSTYAQIEVQAPRHSVFSLPERLRTIVPLTGQKAEVNRKITFSVDPSLRNGIDFTVNGETHANDKDVVAGELQVWEVRNASLMDHPFHLHGFFFQVLEIDGKAPDYLSWKDTLNLKPRSTAKIAWMPDNRPGSWMYHCHILEHHEAGMMGHFQVVDPTVGVQAIVPHHGHAHH